MSAIKLLALDIDGTILTTDKKLTIRTRKAMEEAIAREIKIVLVTGRPLYGIPEDLLEIPGLDYAISSNGAVTTDLRTNTVLRRANLDADTALNIVEIPRKLDLIYAVFIDGVGYSELEPYERHLKLIQNKPVETYIRKSRRITNHMDYMIKNAVYGVENIWLIAHDMRARDFLCHEITEKWNVHTVLTAAQDLEIGHPAADKGIAVLELSEHLQVRNEQIMAIGDNGNDISLLKCAGTSVAMGNASDEIKAIADFITIANDEDGAAIVIEML